MPIFFRWVERKIVSEKIDSTYQKTLNFVEKTLFFGIEK